MNYTDGMDVNQFKAIEGVGYYNHNFHIGLNKDLLYCESDDDNYSAWYIVMPHRFEPLGYSYETDNKLHLSNTLK